MKKKCFAIQPKMKQRVFLMSFGIFLIGFALSVLIKIDLGTDPCSCFALGVSRHIPLSFGTCQFLCHVIPFLLVLKYDRSKISYGTVVNMVFLGYIADFFQWIWDSILPSGFFEPVTVRYGLLLPALAVFICGAASYMCADIGMSPYDALPFILSDHITRFSFRTIRIAWDTAYLLAGFFLGGTVGIVTIAIAFFLGPVVGWFRKRLEVFLA